MGLNKLDSSKAIPIGSQGERIVLVRCSNLLEWQYLPNGSAGIRSIHLSSNSGRRASTAPGSLTLAFLGGCLAC